MTKFRNNVPAKVAIALSLASIGFAHSAFADGFLPGNLIVSSTTYADVGAVSSLAVGNALPGGGTAIANGLFPNVFQNSTPDASFGVTSAISLQQFSTSSDSFVSSMTVDTSQMVTSFSSKSELALNISSDGQSVSFMGYAAPLGALDVSNSNTPGVVDASNPVAASYSRVIGTVNLSTGALQTTDVNSYSGNNGRAAVLVNGDYYMVGNAGNSTAATVTGATLNALSANTGVQMIAQGSSGNSTVIGALSAESQTVSSKGKVTSTGGQYGFDITQATNASGTNLGYAADKTGKDDNFRGMTIYNGTMYVTKGSGSNGINTVYQVGPAGALNNGGSLPANASISILPGFNTALASGSSSTGNPFGLWFANSTTMFVADEGDGNNRGTTGKVTTFAGLQEWNLSNGVWHNTQTFQNGLLNQASYTAGLPWNVYTDGLRNISGQVNADGTFTIYGTTSTVTDGSAAAHDLGADPNEIVSITVGANSTNANTSFNVLSTAVAGQRFGGLAVAPVPEPGEWLLMLGGLGLIGFIAARRKEQNDMAAFA